MVSTPHDLDFVQEKHNAAIDTAHVENLSNTSTSNKENDEIERVDTFDIDIENKLALKGDESDGKFNWTTKQIIATVSLSMIYTGTKLFYTSPPVGHQPITCP